MKVLVRISLALLVFVSISGCSRSQTNPAPTPPNAKLTPADLRKLRWIEGSWRGTGVDQKPFFERYHFESDTVLVVDSFDNEKLDKVTETTRFELKDGEFGGGSEGSLYVASALDDNSITFEPRVKARNSFIWKRESKDAWTAIIKWPASADKPARERTYNMERWPK